MTAFVAYQRNPVGQLEPVAFVTADGPGEAARTLGLAADAVVRDCHEVPAADVLRAQYRMHVRATAQQPDAHRRS